MKTMTAVERAISLRGVEAFREVPIEQLAYVAGVAREERIPAGRTLFEQGDPPGSLYVLLEGKVALEQDGAGFGSASAGEPLGMWSLFDDHARRGTARVEDDARLLVVDRDDFYDVLAEHAEITRSLVQYLVRRLLDLAG